MSSKSMSVQGVSALRAGVSPTAENASSNQVVLTARQRRGKAFKFLEAYKAQCADPSVITFDDAVAEYKSKGGKRISKVFKESFKYLFNASAQVVVTTKPSGVSKCQPKPCVNEHKQEVDAIMADLNLNIAPKPKKQRKRKVKALPDYKVFLNTLYESNPSCDFDDALDQFKQEYNKTRGSRYFRAYYNELFSADVKPHRANKPRKKRKLASKKEKQLKEEPKPQPKPVPPPEEESLGDCIMRLCFGDGPRAEDQYERCGVDTRDPEQIPIEIEPFVDDLDFEVSEDELLDVAIPCEMCTNGLCSKGNTKCNECLEFFNDYLEILEEIEDSGYESSVSVDELVESIASSSSSIDWGDVSEMDLEVEERSVAVVQSAADRYLNSAVDVYEPKKYYNGIFNIVKEYVQDEKPTEEYVVNRIHEYFSVPRNNFRIFTGTAAQWKRQTRQSRKAYGLKAIEAPKDDFNRISDVRKRVFERWSAVGKHKNTFKTVQTFVRTHAPRVEGVEVTKEMAENMMPMFRQALRKSDCCRLIASSQFFLRHVRLSEKVSQQEKSAASDFVPGISDSSLCLCSDSNCLHSTNQIDSVNQESPVSNMSTSSMQLTTFRPCCRYCNSNDDVYYSSSHRVFKCSACNELCGGLKGGMDPSKDGGKGLGVGRNANANANLNEQSDAQVISSLSLEYVNPWGLLSQEEAKAMAFRNIKSLVSSGHFRSLFAKQAIRDAEEAVLYRLAEERLWINMPGGMVVGMMRSLFIQRVQSVKRRQKAEEDARKQKEAEEKKAEVEAFQAEVGEFVEEKVEVVSPVSSSGQAPLMMSNVLDGSIYARNPKRLEEEILDKQVTTLSTVEALEPLQREIVISFLRHLLNKLQEDDYDFQGQKMYVHEAISELDNAMYSRTAPEVYTEREIAHYKAFRKLMKEEVAVDVMVNIESVFRRRNGQWGDAVGISTRKLRVSVSQAAVQNNDVNAFQAAAIRYLQLEALNKLYPIRYNKVEVVDATLPRGLKRVADVRLNVRGKKKVDESQPLISSVFGLVGPQEADITNDGECVSIMLAKALNEYRESERERRRKEGLSRENVMSVVTPREIYEEFVELRRASGLNVKIEPMEEFGFTLREIKQWVEDKGFISFYPVDCNGVMIYDNVTVRARAGDNNNIGRRVLHLCAEVHDKHIRRVYKPSEEFKQLGMGAHDAIFASPKRELFYPKVHMLGYNDMDDWINGRFNDEVTYMVPIDDLSEYVSEVYKATGVMPRNFAFGHDKAQMKVLIHPLTGKPLVANAEYEMVQEVIRKEGGAIMDASEEKPFLPRLDSPLVNPVGVALTLMSKMVGQLPEVSTEGYAAELNSKYCPKAIVQISQALRNNPKLFDKMYCIQMDMNNCYPTMLESNTCPIPIFSDMDSLQAVKPDEVINPNVQYFLRNHSLQGFNFAAHYTMGHNLLELLKLAPQLRRYVVSKRKPRKLLAANVFVKWIRHMKLMYPQLAKLALNGFIGFTNSSSHKESKSYLTEHPDAIRNNFASLFMFIRDFKAGANSLNEYVEHVSKEATTAEEKYLERLASSLIDISTHSNMIQLDDGLSIEHLTVTLHKRRAVNQHYVYNHVMDCYQSHMKKLLVQLAKCGHKVLACKTDSFTVLPKGCVSVNFTIPDGWKNDGVACLPKNCWKAIPKPNPPIAGNWVQVPLPQSFSYVHSFFFDGPAGSGKTTMVFKDICKQMSDDMFPNSELLITSHQNFTVQANKKKFLKFADEYKLKYEMDEFNPSLVIIEDLYRVTFDTVCSYIDCQVPEYYELIVIDEVGMLDARQVSKLVKIWKKHDREPVHVMAGDYEQLPAVCDDGTPCYYAPHSAIFKELCGFNKVTKKYVAGKSRFKNVATLEFMKELRKNRVVPEWAFKNGLIKAPDAKLTVNLTFSNAKRLEIVKAHGKLNNQLVCGDTVQILNDDVFVYNEGRNMRKSNDNGEGNGRISFKSKGLYVGATYQVVVNNVEAKYMKLKPHGAPDEGVIDVKILYKYVCSDVAMTVHKMQGQGLDRPGNIWEADRMSRQQLYTALTRFTDINNVHMDLNVRKAKYSINYGKVVGARVFKVIPTYVIPVTQALKDKFAAEGKRVKNWGQWFNYIKPKQQKQEVIPMIDVASGEVVEQKDQELNDAYMLGDISEEEMDKKVLGVVKGSDIKVDCDNGFYVLATDKNDLNVLEKYKLNKNGEVRFVKLKNKYGSDVSSYVNDYEYFERLVQDQLAKIEVDEESKKVKWVGKGMVFRKPLTFEREVRAPRIEKRFKESNRDEVLATIQKQVEKRVRQSLRLQKSTGSLNMNKYKYAPKLKSEKVKDANDYDKGIVINQDPTSEQANAMYFRRTRGVVHSENDVKYDPNGEVTLRYDGYRRQAKPLAIEQADGKFGYVKTFKFLMQGRGAKDVNAYFNATRKDVARSILAVYGLDSKVKSEVFDEICSGAKFPCNTFQEVCSEMSRLVFDLDMDSYMCEDMCDEEKVNALFVFINALRNYMHSKGVKFEHEQVRVCKSEGKKFSFHISVLDQVFPDMVHMKAMAQELTDYILADKEKYGCLVYGRFVQSDDKCKRYVKMSKEDLKRRVEWMTALDLAIYSTNRVMRMPLCKKPRKNNRLIPVNVDYVNRCVRDVEFGHYAYSDSERRKVDMIKLMEYFVSVDCRCMHSISVFSKALSEKRVNSKNKLKVKVGKQKECMLPKKEVKLVEAFLSQMEGFTINDCTKVMVGKDFKKYNLKRSGDGFCKGCNKHHDAGGNGACIELWGDKWVVKCYKVGSKPYVVNPCV